ncbi:MAG TPA: hypothetical protein VFQ56_07645 [Flavobacterium sp.]|nr:hypothetical protein [Flavobacterium sp.]
MKAFTFSDGNKKKAGILELEFILNHGTSQLKSSIESSDLVISRSSVLLTILSGLSLSLIAFLSLEIEKGNFSSARAITGAFCFFYVMIIVKKVIKNIKGRSVATLGLTPNLLLHDWYFEQKDLDAKKLLLLEMIDVTQKAITKNAPLNKKRWKRYNRALKLVAAIPLVALFFYCTTIAVTSCL